MMKAKVKGMLATVLLGTMLLGGSALAADNAAAADTAAITQQLTKLGGIVQLVGVPNPYGAHFTGQSYLANLSTDASLPVSNVTFVNGAHTYWHIHHNSCQVLVPQSGRGYYQIWGQKPQELKPGMTVTIPAGVKHWHGAAPGTSFQHIALMNHGDNVTTEWLEPVNEKEYKALK